jgi:hypothetical protein
MTLSGRFERFIERQRKSLSVISVKLIPLPSQASHTSIACESCLEPALLAGLLGTNLSRVYDH